MKKALALCLVSLLIAAQVSAFSLAEDISWDGKVISAQTEKIICPLTGTIEECLVHDGDPVKKDQPLMTVTTHKVYAAENGTAYISGQAGDSVEMLVQRFGAPAYLEPAYIFTVSSSTKTGSGSEAARRILPGEKVYLRSTANSSHTGAGTIAKVENMNYTVEVTEGNLETNESVNIYRDAAYTASQRIGRGMTSRVYPIPYTGTGLGHVVRFHVQNGQSVKRGDLLFETLEGTVPPTQLHPDAVIAPENGTVVSLALHKGDPVLENDPALLFYADKDMRISVEVLADELSFFEEGDQVLLTLPGTKDEVVRGTVEKISLVPVVSAEGTEVPDTEAKYAVYIIPDDTELFRYDMPVTVTLH